MEKELLERERIEEVFSGKNNRQQIKRKKQDNKKRLPKADVITKSVLRFNQNGWSNWIRTSECRSQSPVPYRLAILQNMVLQVLGRQRSYLKHYIKGPK